MKSNDEGRGWLSGEAGRKGERGGGGLWEGE